MPDDQQLTPARRFRLRFNLRQLFVAVTLVAVGLGIWNWLLRNVVEVRAANRDDKFAARYFGFTEQSVKVRNIAVATGTLTTKSRLVASLHLVQRRKTGDYAAYSVGGTPNAEGGSVWRTMVLRLALGEMDVPGGRHTYLGAAGFSRNGGCGGGFTHNINVVDKQTLPGRITPGRPHIVYVEGDQKINVDGKMTLEEFAKVNPGNYLVVAVELR